MNSGNRCFILLHVCSVLFVVIEMMHLSSRADRFALAQYATRGDVSAKINQHGEYVFEC